MASISLPCNAAPPRPKIGRDAKPSGEYVDAPVLDVFTLIVCTTPLTVGKAVNGTAFAAAYAFAEPVSVRMTRCFDAAFTAFVKFA
ncbi:hypothetical protein, partial [Burkholderia sp. BDU5]|uniref:hypothetical protein n=1 Tax=Burkholderia sp. BDU5 TaxID=1385590 RepID=UPI001E4E00A1